MVTTQQSDKEDEISRETLTGTIGKNVVNTLGKPSGIFKVKVHAVGNHYYRVNVLVGEYVTSARIAHSFFLTADHEGNIVGSTPEIVRVY